MAKPDLKLRIYLYFLLFPLDLPSLSSRIFLVLGVWTAVLSYLGFPYSWKNILFSLTGLVIIYLSFTLYQEHKEKTGEKSFDNFRENADFQPSAAPTEVPPSTEPNE